MSKYEREDINEVTDSEKIRRGMYCRSWWSWNWGIRENKVIDGSYGQRMGYTKLRLYRDYWWWEGLGLWTYNCMTEVVWGSDHWKRGV